MGYYGEHGVMIGAQVGISFNSQMLGLEQLLHPKLSGQWQIILNLAEKSKLKRARASSQTFVALSKSLQNHSFKLAIAWPLGIIGCQREISVRKGADLEKQNCLFGADLRKRTLLSEKQNQKRRTKPERSQSYA